MRRPFPLLAAGVLLSLGAGVQAQAQQLPPPPLQSEAAAGITLHLSQEQTKLIVDTLGAVGCQNVAQLAVCNKVLELRVEIARQASPQVK